MTNIPSKVGWRGTCASIRLVTQPYASAFEAAVSNLVDVADHRACPQQAEASGLDGGSRAGLGSHVSDRRRAETLIGQVAAIYEAY